MTNDNTDYLWRSVQAVAPEGEEGPLCVICQDVIISDGSALWCGHVFHRQCLVEWRDCANKTIRDCPYRCHEQPAPPPPLLVLI